MTKDYKTWHVYIKIKADKSNSPTLVDYYVDTQERLVLSILPRFVALEMISDMSSLEDELSSQELHKIYIHQYRNVR